MNVRRVPAVVALVVLAVACGGGTDSIPTIPTAPPTSAVTTTTVPPTTTATTTEPPAPVQSTTTTTTAFVVPTWAEGAASEDFERFLLLLDDYFADAGIAYAIDVQAGVIGTGEEFSLGLVSLWQTVAGSAAEDWPDLVAGHFDQVYATIAANPGVPPTWEDGAPLVRIRLYDASFFDALGEAAGDLIRRELTSELFATVVLDLPTAVRPLSGLDVEPWNVEDDEVFGTALASTLADPDLVVEPFVFETGDDMLSVYNSSFSSSAVLELGQFVDDLSEDGALIILPVEDAMVIHVIDDDTTRATFDELAVIADSWYDDGPSSLSPLVFWWRDGRVEELGFVVPGAGPAFRSGIGDEFLELIEA